MASYESYGVGEWVVSGFTPNGDGWARRFETEAEANAAADRMRPRNYDVHVHQEKGRRRINVSEWGAMCDGG